MVAELIADLRTFGHLVSWVHIPDQLVGGDICFYLGCSVIVDSCVREKYCNNLVIHASDLPKGKGWSPLNWQIIEGKNDIPIVLFEAVDKVDAGAIYMRSSLKLKGYELLSEIKELLAIESKAMILGFISKYPESLLSGKEQIGQTSYYQKRGAADSEIDPHVSIIDSFNKIRAADNEDYPIFFKYLDKKYIIKIYREQ